MSKKPRPRGNRHQGIHNRIATSAAAIRRSAIQKEAKKTIVLSIGCRYEDPGSGCRCGRLVVAGMAFCEDHVAKGPKTIHGLQGSSLSGTMRSKW